MVAYSFKPFFAPQIEGLTKLQTVRANRKRHARPGEPVQLFTGMRTRSCRKLVDPDPICREVLPIVIVTTSMLEDIIGSISVAGVPLNRAEIEAFAIADGFGIEHIGDTLFKQTGRRGSARCNMGLFWEAEHGFGRFEGVLVKWRPA